MRNGSGLSSRVRQTPLSHPAASRGLFFRKRCTVLNLLAVVKASPKAEEARAAQNVPAGVAKRPVRVRSKDQRVEVLLDQLTVRPAGIELGLAEARSDKVSARKSRMRCALVPCSSPKTRRCVDWPSTPGGEYRVLRKARANGPVPFVCAPISNRPARPAASLSRRSTANSPRSRR